jgi:hypothetical protein
VPGRGAADRGEGARSTAANEPGYEPQRSAAGGSGRGSVVSDHRDRARLFRQVGTYLQDRRGEDAVLRALCAPEPLEEVWALPLEAFRAKMRRMLREALREAV